MKNLIKRITQENKNSLTKFNAELKEYKTIKDVLNIWFYKNLLTATTRRKEWLSAKELKDYLIVRNNKKQAKDLESTLKRIETISNAKEIEKITVSVEWKNNRTWGSNPTATAEVYYKGGGYDNFSSGSISGCGYDKGSTAVAIALNQVNGLLKLMYTEKNRPTRVNKANGDVFGYGSGHGILPSISGGVGVSCYPRIMEKLKLSFETIASGKTYDVYTISQ